MLEIAIKERNTKITEQIGNKLIFIVIVNNDMTNPPGVIVQLVVFYGRLNRTDSLSEDVWT